MEARAELDGELVGGGLGSFQPQELRLWRMRCTLQVCTLASGKTAGMASGKPLSPSTTAMSTSSKPRLPVFGDPRSERLHIDHFVLVLLLVHCSSSSAFPSHTNFPIRPPSGAVFPDQPPLLGPDAPPSQEFPEAQPQLREKKLLRLYYSRARFGSPEAKDNFVPPDLAPLPGVRAS